MSNCPSCKNHLLRPVKLDLGLPAQSCSNCQGYLIELLSYRLWLEGRPESKSRQSLTQQSPDSKSALHCPKCQRIMTKFRISDEVANKIDLCSGCGELWLDGGEWEALEVLDLAGAIPKILSDPWQKAIRIKETSMKYEARQKDMLGDADHSRLSEFCIWMQSHAKRREIIDYINRKNAET